MKTSVVLSALLSFGILGLAAGFFVARSTGDARAAAGDAGASDLSLVEERLAALEKGIEALGDLRSDIDALKRRPESRSEPAAQPETSETPAEEKPTVAVSLGDEEVPSTKLELWLDGQGMRGEFDDLVSKTYEKARTSRLARERAEQEERAKEMEALSQGPYGKYNYRVNSLSKKLGLDTRQEQYVHNLFLNLEERRRQAMEQFPKLEGEFTPDQLKEHRDHVVQVNQELSQQFENDLLASLNAKQRELYESMPEHERMSGDSVNNDRLRGQRRWSARHPCGSRSQWEPSRSPSRSSRSDPAPPPAPAK